MHQIKTSQLVRRISADSRPSQSLGASIGEAPDRLPALHKQSSKSLCHSIVFIGIALLDHYHPQYSPISRVVKSWNPQLIINQQGFSSHCSSGTFSGRCWSPARLLPHRQFRLPFLHWVVPCALALPPPLVQSQRNISYVNLKLANVSNDHKSSYPTIHDYPTIQHA